MNRPRKPWTVKRGPEFLLSLILVQTVDAGLEISQNLMCAHFAFERRFFSYRFSRLKRYLNCIMGTPLTLHLFCFNSMRFQRSEK